MSDRAFLKDVLFALAFIGVCVLLLSPPVISGIMGGSGWNAISFGVSLAVMLILFLVFVIPIKLSHWRMRKSLKKFRRVIKELLAFTEEYVSNLGDRMSRLATYRKGHSLLVRQGTDSRPYTNSLVALYKMKGNLEDILTYYGNGFGAPSYAAAASSEDVFPTWGDAKEAIETPGFFDVFPVTPYEECPFNGSLGRSATVKRPYGFITSMTLERISLYDKHVEPLFQQVEQSVAQAQEAKQA